MVKEFLEKNATKIRLILLPPYSPELNPDELVWNDLKNNCLGRKAIVSAEQLKAEVISFLRFLQKTPERIRSYFQAPTTCYAS
jgi:transposase